MRDSRYEKLADLLVGYSVALKEGDFVLIDVSDAPEAFFGCFFVKCAVDFEKFEDCLAVGQQEHGAFCGEKVFLILWEALCLYKKILSCQSAIK